MKGLIRAVAVLAWEFALAAAALAEDSPSPAAPLPGEEAATAAVTGPGSRPETQSGETASEGPTQEWAPADDEQGPWRLLDGPFFSRNRIEVGGWIDQGFTGNARAPANRSNFPVGYNDRSNDYELNQLWVYVARPAETGGSGWDWGGRVDFTWGTDARYLTAEGLEDRWNGDGLYQLALPQLYAEVACNDFSLKIGHFWSTFGYEQAPAPENFFYSHANSFTRIQPRTFTGLLGTYRLNDRLSVYGGVHRGWNNWEDDNDSLGGVGGVSWENPDSGTGFAVVLSAGPESDQVIHPNFDTNVTSVEVILRQRITGRLTYVVEHTNTRATTTREFERIHGLRADDHAYGINQYLLYRLNPRLAVGMRLEWVAEVLTLELPQGGGQVRAPINLYAITWGVNWAPTRNLTIRPEIRWDWSDRREFDLYGAFDQFLAARFISGLGIGASSMICPIYIAEVAPPRRRGLRSGPGRLDRRHPGPRGLPGGQPAVRPRAADRPRLGGLLQPQPAPQPRPRRRAEGVPGEAQPGEPGPGPREGARIPA